MVSGVSGLVGSHVSLLAKQKGWPVVGVSRVLNHSAGWLAARTKDEYSQIMTATKPDVLVYCSANTNVDACEKTPEACLFDNALFPGMVCHEALKQGIRFVFLSTSYVFRGEKPTFEETDKPSPLNWYGEAKWLAEKLVLFHGKGNSMVIRTMGVYGLDPEGKDFLSQVIQAVSKKQRIRVANDQFGNFTFAGDLATNILKLIDNSADGIWHVAGPQPTLCRCEIAKEICKMGGWDQNLIEEVPTSALNQAAARPRFGGLDISKILSRGMKMRSLAQVWPT